MSNASDFIIENGVLKKYVGPGGDVVIPDGVTAIGSKVFSSLKNVSSVIIPMGVTDVGDRAFYGVPLEKVHIPDSVITVQQFVFRETNPVLCKPKAVVFAGKVLLYYGGQSEKYKIPAGTKAIADGAFSSQKLISVVIPDSVVHIGTDAFLNCPNIETIDISKETADNIGKSVIKAAFFKLPSKREEQRDYQMEKSLMVRILQGGIQLGGLESHFLYEIRQKTVREDLAMYFIRRNAAAALSNLLKKQEQLLETELVAYLNAADTYGAMDAKAVILDARSGNSVETEKLADDAFAVDWKKIFKLSYKPEGAIISGYKGTDDQITIPRFVGNRAVVSIKESAFAFDGNVKKVVLSEGIKTIEGLAFSTSELEEITIPASVSEIGEGAFYACLVTIHAPAGSYAETYAKENNIPFVAE